MPVKYHQQPYALKESLTAAGVTHGTTARVDLIGGHSQPSAASPGGPAKFFFCNATVNVRQELERGDGGPLSEVADLAAPLRRAFKGLHEPNVNIENAIVRCNGSNRIMADEQTVIRIPGKKLGLLKGKLPDRVIPVLAPA